MKNKIKIYISALTIILLFSLGIRSINADELMELKLNKNNIELAVGSSYQLKAIDRENAGSKIQWLFVKLYQAYASARSEKRAFREQILYGKTSWL